MKKHVALLALAACSTAAQASINLNIWPQYLTVTRPTSGTSTAVFSGTLQVIVPTYDVTSAVVEVPFTSTNNAVIPVLDPGFSAYVAGNSPGLGYSGALFSIAVTPSTPLELFWLNSGTSGLMVLSEVIVSASDSSNNVANDNEAFGLNVVPEPATLAAIGLGCAALLRRRRAA